MKDSDTRDLQHRTSNIQEGNESDASLGRGDTAPESNTESGNSSDRGGEEEKDNEEQQAEEDNNDEKTGDDGSSDAMSPMPSPIPQSNSRQTPTTSPAPTPLDMMPPQPIFNTTKIPLPPPPPPPYHHLPLPLSPGEAWRTTLDWSRHHNMAAVAVTTLPLVAVLFCAIRRFYRCWKDVEMKREQQSFDLRSAQARMLLGDMQMEPVPTTDPDEEFNLS